MRSPRDEPDFELEAEQDVEVVGDFIGLDADERALDGIGCAPAVLPVVAGQVGESPDEVWPPGFPEGVAAAHPVFPKTGLGLVDAKRGSLAERGAELLLGQALVIQAVPGLVKNAVERDHEIRLVVAGGHAGVVGAEPGAEGMGAGVQPAGGGVETYFGKEGLEKLFLVGARIVAGKVFTGGVSRDGKSLFGNRDEAGLEFCKKSGDFPGFPAGFIAFQQGVVGLVGVAPEVSHAAGEGEEFFEVGGEG